MKIAISIPTYNRKNKIALLAKSLQYVKRIETHEIYIRDDCSTEFNATYLESLFPSASISANEKNFGADRNTYMLCRDFLKTECDYLFLCDSDLILHEDALLYIECTMPHTQGVLSLLNATSHQHIVRKEKEWLIKQYVGSAGVVFSRSIVSELVRNIPYKNAIMWDWAFCTYLKKKGIDIYVSNRSYVLHLGIDGENSSPLLFDFSMNYVPSTDFDRMHLCALYQQFADELIQTPNVEKVKVLIRAVARKWLRKTTTILFGDELLFRILSYKKRLLRRKRY